MKRNEMLGLVIEETKIIGSYIIYLKKHTDVRGNFVKIFSSDSLQLYNLEYSFKEVYYSKSVKNVLRGLHFQLPPMEHTKLVHVISGKIFDVIVDLRIGSPTYGEFWYVELSEEKPSILYVPKGLAHGFYTLSETATVIYLTSTTYSPALDSGILWNSLDIPWPSKDPILSDRDKNFIHFSKFQSPFLFKP